MFLIELTQIYLFCLICFQWLSEGKDGANRLKKVVWRIYIAILLGYVTDGLNFSSLEVKDGAFTENSSYPSWDKVTPAKFPGISCSNDAEPGPVFPVK